MRRLLTSLAIFGVGLLMPVTASADKQLDQQIAQQVSARISHQKQTGQLQGFQLDMQVDNGVVVLTGHVSTSEQRYQVLDIVRRIRGVLQVVNGIKVRSADELTESADAAQVPASIVPLDNEPLPIPASSPAMPQSVMARPVQPQPIAMASEQAQPIAQPIAQPMVRPVPSAAIAQNEAAPVAGDQRIADEITMKLKQQKQAGKLQGFGINMQVINGSVWMKGRVSSPEQLTLVLDIARRVEGVRQVVNELSIASAQASAEPPQVLASQGKSVLKNMFTPGASQAEAEQYDAAADGSNMGYGTGIVQATEQQPVPTPLVDQPPASQRRLGPPPAAGPPAFAQPPVGQPGAVPQMAQNTPSMLIPNYRQPSGQRPLAYGPSSAAGSSNNAIMQQVSQPMMGGYIPSHLPPNGIGVTPAQHDHPQLPAYAWPSYAPHPNYGAVNYPKQYSPTAWPYIGPFYPYPQVPLGWREVSLKWKDGWWMLDFHDRHLR